MIRTEVFSFILLPSSIILAAEVLPRPLIGLDLNPSRVRAVQGPPQNVPMTLPLAGNHDELPLALSLEERTLAVGAAGTALRRQKSYLACLDFLGHLGTRKEWKSGRHRLDALGALHHVFQQVQATVRPTPALFTALPPYFTHTQQALRAQPAANHPALPLRSLLAP